MNVKIEVIPHDQQRYPTVGDWFFRKEAVPVLPDVPGDITQKYEQQEVLIIRVSKLSDWRREMLIAIHELVEVVLCKDAGITQEAVDRFDMSFEKERKEGNDDEPGDDPRAPYVRQHCIATGVERILAAAMAVNWKPYEEELYKLP